MPKQVKMESYVQQRLEQIADKWARVRARVADSYAISYKAKLIHRENNILNGGYKACQQERLAAHQHWADARPASLPTKASAGTGV